MNAMNAMNGKTLSLVVTATLGVATAASAALNYAGGTYTQNFDGLPNAGSKTNTGRGPHDLNDRIIWDNTAGSTGMDGWTGSNHAGSSTNTEMRAQDGSLAGSAGRGVISFGTNGSTDRAIGILATSNQISRYGLSLTNTSSDTYASMNLSFIGEQWRKGEPGVSNTLAFAYSLTATDINTGAFTADSSFDFNTIDTTGDQVAIDGNLPANRLAVSGSLNGLNWAPGTTLTLRWTGNDVSGQDSGIAIDDLSLTGIVPEPTSAAAGALVASGALLARRRMSR
jgi:hypothetical protein